MSNVINTVPTYSANCTCTAKTYTLPVQRRLPTRIPKTPPAPGTVPQFRKKPYRGTIVFKPVEISQGSIIVCFLSLLAKASLKVGGNEKQWGSGRSQMLGNGLGPWRSRFIYKLNTQLLNKNHISFSALSSKINNRLL
jgi:hypothetical protein